MTASVVRGFARFAGLLAIAVGGAVLLGWTFRVPELTTLGLGDVPMKTNTAIALILLGGAFVVHVHGQRRLVARVLAGGAMVIGAATLFEYATGIDLGIDQALFDELGAAWPNRMSIAAALDNVLLGLCVILPARPKAKFDIHLVLSPIALLAAWSALLAYAYDLGEHHPEPLFGARIAVHTAAAFMLLALAVLALRSEQLLVRMMTSGTQAGRIARFKIPAAILFPSIAGFVVIKASEGEQLPLDVGVFIVCLAMVLFFLIVVVWGSTSLYVHEAALRDSEQRFRTFVVTVAQVVWAADASGHVTADVHGWCRFTGQTPEQMQGEGWLDAVHPDDREATRADWREAVAQGRPFFREFRLRAADGGYIFTSGRATPVRDDDGPVRSWLGINIDISARRRAEEARAEFAVRLERSNHDLEQFAAVASHDLQEPLRKIQMFGALLRDSPDAKLGPEAASYLQRMENAATRGMTLVRGLLSYSRVTTKAQPPAPVDLNVCVKEVLADLEAAIAQSGAQVVVDPLPTVEADGVQMRQLFQNLIGNSLKFHGAEPPRVRVCARERQGAWELSVADNGIGFDEKYLDRIFKLFQRLHERHKYEGAGLGLAICKKIAERHGGSITARSAPGQGATFVVTLPAHGLARQGAAA